VLLHRKKLDNCDIEDDCHEEASIGDHRKTIKLEYETKRLKLQHVSFWSPLAFAMGRKESSPQAGTSSKLFTLKNC
jgi:hypothetical protein